MSAGRQDAGNLGQHERRMAFAMHKTSTVEKRRVWNQKSASCWRMRRTGWVASSWRHVSGTRMHNASQHMSQKRRIENDRKTRWQLISSNFSIRSLEHNAKQYFTPTTILRIFWSGRSMVPQHDLTMSCSPDVLRFMMVIMLCYIIFLPPSFYFCL